MSDLFYSTDQKQKKWIQNDNEKPKNTFFIFILFSFWHKSSSIWRKRFFLFSVLGLLLMRDRHWMKHQGWTQTLPHRLYSSLYFLMSFFHSTILLHAANVCSLANSHFRTTIKTHSTPSIHKNHLCYVLLIFEFPRYYMAGLTTHLKNAGEYYLMVWGWFWSDEQTLEWYYSDQSKATYVKGVMYWVFTS